MGDVDLGLAGRAYVVTGASRGLGLATARVLVDEGASVVVTGRDHDRLAAAVAALGEDRAEGVVAAQADPAAADHAVGASLARFGRVDGALVSVGGPPAGGALEIPDQAWRDAFESVFLGAVRLARALVPALPEPAVTGEGGSLVLALSTSVRQPIAGLAASNGLRPGLAMWAKTLADELGPQGVRVNGLLTGRVLTDRIRELDAGRDAAAAEEQRAGIPLRRDGDPAEFGRVAAFLLSPAASYVTGAMVPVDGGSLRPL